MAYLNIILAIFVATASAKLATERSACDPSAMQSCAGLIVTTGSQADICNGAKAALNCLSTAASNPTCPAAVQAALQQALSSSQTYLSTVGCSKRETQRSACDPSAMQSCAGLIVTTGSQADICNGAKAALNCLSTAASNPSCPAAVQAALQQALSSSQTYLSTVGCSKRETQRSACDPSAMQSCAGLIVTTGSQADICNGAKAALNCLSTAASNPSCPAAVQAALQQALSSSQTYLSTVGCSKRETQRSACDPSAMQSCAGLIVTTGSQADICNGAKAALNCLSTAASNPSCPAAVQAALQQTLSTYQPYLSTFGCV